MISLKYLRDKIKRKGKNVGRREEWRNVYNNILGRFYEYSGQSMSMGQLGRDGCVHICVPGEE